MTGGEWARTFAAYNRWMNERLYAASAGLSDAERKRDRGAFFRSIHGTLRYTSIVKPAPRELPLWLALTHFFNHQTHHRGQLTTLLHQAGVDPGVTDLIWLPGVPGSG